MVAVALRLDTDHDDVHHRRGAPGAHVNGQAPSAMKGWKGYAITFLAGVLVCGAVALWIGRNSGADLNKQLAAAADTDNALRTSLADAVSANHGLADQVSRLQGQLDRSSRLLAIDDAAIAAGQRILNGITSGINASGGDIEKTIGAIADGFGRLYRLYHPDKGGPAKSPG